MLWFWLANSELSFLLLSTFSHLLYIRFIFPNIYNTEHVVLLGSFEQDEFWQIDEQSLRWSSFWIGLIYCNNVFTDQAFCIYFLNWLYQVALQDGCHLMLTLPRSYYSWIYICSQCLDKTLSDEVWQCPAAGRWFSLVIPAYFINKTDHHYIMLILLKVSLSTSNSHTDHLFPRRIQQT